VKKLLTYFHLCISILLCSFSASGASNFSISGELKKWHRINITFQGPQLDESAEDNPFLNYRLNVLFRHGDKEYLVPGFYAADGNAAETGATNGNRWRVYFLPDEIGVWNFTVSFRRGQHIAIELDEKAGQPTDFDGVSGKFTIEKSDKLGNDFRAKGLLRYVGEHYLQFAETGDFYLKAGADSPENFLAYVDFDGTGYANPQRVDRQGEAKKKLPKGLHQYQPHAKDWRPGDPTWRHGKGKNIIGALNYLASRGVNSVYFLTMNVEGDGNDVWPWISPHDYFRFDCSKLDQWEIVFSHMDKLGILMHVLTQETENDQLLDEGELGVARKLYYRELIARFAHHPALVWNLGEENTNTNAQRKAFASYIRSLDPYKHPIVVHTFPGKYDSVYTPLLGYPNFEGPSLQMGAKNLSHTETLKWVKKSEKAGRKWIVCVDEIGPARTGVKPDADDYWHDDVRKQVLWGNLMAGGSGCEWYFGYKYPNNDLNCEDWRSRDHIWVLTRIAVDFFQNYLPFTEMQSQDELTTAANDYCFAKPCSVYAIYLPDGGTTELKIDGGRFKISWYNPRTGGDLQDGSIKQIVGPGLHSIGQPPEEADKDWVALIKRI